MDREKEYNTRDWKNTFIEQERRIKLILEDSPSIKFYQDALHKVIIITKLSDRFSQENPYDLSFYLA